MSTTPNLPHSSTSSMMLDTLLDFVKQHRVLSPIREKHLLTHPDEIVSLVEKVPGGADLLMLPDNPTQTNSSAEVRRWMQAAIERLDRLSDERHTDGIAVTETDIEALDTQAHMAVLPVPMKEQVTLYRWHSILPRNIRRMVVESVARHLWQHGTHPASIRLSRRNALWARLLVGPEYRMHLRADAKMDNNTIVCEGGEMWQK